MMKVLPFNVNPFQENSYLVTQNKRAIVIDPGFYNATEMSILNQALLLENAKLEAIVLTHAHLDHVFGIDRVRGHHGEIPVYLHKEDAYFWENYMLSAARFGFEVKPFDFDPEWVEAGLFEVAGMHFDARFTPGHAPGHLAYYNSENGLVLSGDALFRESVGRTDLYKGDFDILEESIKTQLYTLPDDTTVYPGHGTTTTIGHEKRHNPFVKA